MKRMDETRDKRSATDGEEETFGRAFAAGMTPFGLFELVRRG